MARTTPVSIQPANQMWIQGCVMAIMFRGFDFDSWNGQTEGDFLPILKQEFDSAIDHYFPDNKSGGSIDWCIAQCLKYNPENRVSAVNLQPHLEAILESHLAKEVQEATDDIRAMLATLDDLG